MKKIIAILLITIMAIGAAACQKTPESPIVVGKNNTAMIEKAQEMPTLDLDNGKTLKAKTQAKDALVYELSKDNMILSVNAPICIPDTNGIGISRVVPGSFSQEQISAIWSELIGNTEMFYTSAEMTKPEIEAAIVFTKNNIAQAVNEDDKLRYEAQLAYFTGIYDSAPDEKELERDYGVLRELFLYQYGSDTKTAYSGINAASKDGAVRFTVNNYFESNGASHFAALEYNREEYAFADNIAPSVESYYVDINSKTIPENASVLNIAPAVAAAQIRQLFDNVNVPFTVSSATLNKSGDTWYYRFLCTRLVDDIPCAFVFGESYYDDGIAAFAQTWDYETMSVTVDNVGIRSLAWSSPIEISERIVENSSVMVFSDIQAMAEKMLFVTYDFQTHGVKSLKLNVSDIKLETLRVVEQGAKKSGLLIPVWNFYGTRHLEYEDGSKSSTNEMILLAVNAIDGSIIDLARGY